MPFQVDQSNKVEQTAADTALALCNDHSYTVLLPAAVKRECLALLRRRGYDARAITLRLFSAALCTLLELAGSVEQVTVDTEYSGYERDIRNLLLNWIRPKRPDLELVFMQVGKKSSAHITALRVARGQQKADLVLTTGRLLKLLK